MKDNNNLLKWKNHTIRPLAYSTIPVYTFIKDDLTRSYKKETKTYKARTIPEMAPLIRNQQTDHTRIKNNTSQDRFTYNR